MNTPISPPASGDSQVAERCRDQRHEEGDRQRDQLVVLDRGGRGALAHAEERWCLLDQARPQRRGVGETDESNGERTRPPGTARDQCAPQRDDGAGQPCLDQERAFGIEIQRVQPIIQAAPGCAPLEQGNGECHRDQGAERPDRMQP